MIQPTQLIWQGAGSPEPCDTTGLPIPRSSGESHCAKCGAPAPAGEYTEKQIVSENFLPTRNANRLRAFGGRRYCAACVFASKALRLRCISWFATEERITFWRTRPAEPGAPRPDAMSALLAPPEPPFVVAVPLYGIAHGGENNWRRTWWPGQPLPANPLIKLQSKHVALYARVATSRDRYPVQVDDQHEFMLDRDVWLRARDDASALMRALANAGVKPYPARLSVKFLQLPSRPDPALAASWPKLTAPLRPHVDATWWPLFCELLLSPEEATTDATT